MAELADALDSKSSALYGREGSSPSSGTLLIKGFSRFPLADSKAYNFKCPLFVPRLLSGRCHDDAHTASNLV